MTHSFRPAGVAGDATLPRRCCGTFARVGSTTRSGNDDRARGGDRRRRPDRADVGGRAGVGGDRRRRSSNGAPTRSSTARAPAGCTRAPSRCSISAASPSGSSPRARRCRCSGFGGIPLDISDFPTRHNYGLALWQRDFERILAGWVDELGVPILRGREVVGFAQDDTGVDVELSDGASLRAEYLVGCDGGRSVIRKAAGIDFAGLDPSTSWMIAEVEMAEEPEFGVPPRGRRHRPRDRSREGGEPYRSRAHRTRRRTRRRPDHERASRGTRRRATGRTTGCAARPGSPGSPT